MARIESLHIKGYGPLRDVRVDGLGGFNVFVGPNGSGKSRLLDSLLFLRDALDLDVPRAVKMRGGMKSLTSMDGQDRFAISTRLSDAEGDVSFYTVAVLSKDERYKVSEIFNQTQSSEYGLCVDVEVEDGKAVITAVNVNMPDGGSVTNVNGDGKELFLHSASAFTNAGHLGEVVRLLSQSLFLDLSIDASDRRDAANLRPLPTDPETLAQRALDIHERHPEQYERLLNALRHHIPGLQNVETKRTEDDRLILRFNDGAFADPFGPAAMSDGTLKLFAFLVVLYDPDPPGLLLVEEPERQLYPGLLLELAEEFRQYAKRGGQVFITTHSPEFLSACRIEEVVWLEKEDGFTVARRASEMELVRNLVNEGESLGAILRMDEFRTAARL